MKKLSYFEKVRLRRALKIGGIVAGGILLLGAARFIYVGRFIVYDETGAHLDYSRGTADYQVAETAPLAEDYPVIRERSVSAEAFSGKHFAGVRLNGKQVQDSAALDGLTDTLGEYGAIMLPVKSATGAYYYDSQWDFAEVTAQKKAVRAFVKEAKKKNLYLIAELPAFADSAYAVLDHDYSLQIKGGALWMNADGSYCLDPAKEHTEKYLLAELRELKKLGFDEVLLTGFDFPESASLVYSGDGQEAVRILAQKLTEGQGKNPIRVSFDSADETVAVLSDHRFVSDSSDADPEDSERYIVLTEEKTEDSLYSTLFPVTT